MRYEPRAAWQLVALGFEDVYDFVSGKAEWIANGLPVEGKGPHYPLVGEVARRDIVHESRLGSQVGASRTAVAHSRYAYCVVLNDHDILMGRLRRKHLQKRGRGDRRKRYGIRSYHGSHNRVGRRFAQENGSP